MGITIAIIVLTIVILSVFLYFFWQEDETENQQFVDKQDLDTLHQHFHHQKHHINPQIFLKGLENLTIEQTKFRDLHTELHQKIIGMNEFINGLIITLLTGGHALVEGLPGLAKTRTIATLAQLCNLDFRRIQFTPDMLPSDITGVEIYDLQSKQFETKHGPIFAQIILADEINRATPKVQSALLEAMQEKQVTINGKTHALPRPFFVLATQNPIDQEGTYVLPEAQIDRFLCKILVNYPTLTEEKKILDTLEHDHTKLKKIISANDLLKAQKEIETIEISDTIKEYITKLVHATRNYQQYILYGASPRASIALLFASKTLAWLQGRDHVIYEDVQSLALMILRHRVIFQYHISIDINQSTDHILAELLSNVKLGS